MIRATTVGVLKSYRSNLMKSFIAQNTARDNVLKPRNFHSYADDPAAASQAYQIRRSLQRTASQITVSDSVTRKYETAYKALESVVDIVDNGKSDSSYDSVLRTLNDPTGDARISLGKVLNQLADDIVQNMNSKYGDNFIFAGADGLNVPFEIRDDGHLYYRGVNVDTELPKVAMDGNQEPVSVDENGELDANGTFFLRTEDTSVIKIVDYEKMVQDQATDPGIQLPKVLQDTGKTLQKVNEDGVLDATGEYYLVTTDASVISEEEYRKAQEDLEKLDFLNNEKYFVDIGLGMQEDGQGALIESSAFNASLPGISFLGYGVDEDGDPKNLVSLIRQMATKATEYSQAEWTKESGEYQEFNRLANKFEAMASNLHTMHVDMTAKAGALKDNNDLLTGKADTLKEQIVELEDMNEVEAISEFIWAQYCYNSALKVGNKVLSESLMDYMS